MRKDEARLVLLWIALLGLFMTVFVFAVVGFTVAVLG